MVACCTSDTFAGSTTIFVVQTWPTDNAARGARCSILTGLTCATYSMTNTTLCKLARAACCTRGCATRCDSTKRRCAARGPGRRGWRKATGYAAVPSKSALRLHRHSAPTFRRGSGLSGICLLSPSSARACRPARSRASRHRSSCLHPNGVEHSRTGRWPCGTSARARRRRCCCSSPLCKRPRADATRSYYSYCKATGQRF